MWTKRLAMHPVENCKGEQPTTIEAGLQIAAVLLVSPQKLHPLMESTDAMKSISGGKSPHCV